MSQLGQSLPTHPTPAMANVGYPPESGHWLLPRWKPAEANAVMARRTAARPRICQGSARDRAPLDMTKFLCFISYACSLRGVNR